MRYRYRSLVLLGAWQRTARLACADAIRARQASMDEAGDMTWHCGAGIEAAANCEVAAPLS